MSPFVYVGYHLFSTSVSPFVVGREVEGGVGWVDLKRIVNLLAHSNLNDGHHLNTFFGHFPSCCCGWFIL